MDHGNNAGVTATDQRGRPRIHNATVDIGAIEMAILTVVNQNGSGIGSLRQAIITANAQGYGDIVFDPGYFNQPRTISHEANGELLITSAITIIGPALATDRLTVSGGELGRVFKIAPSVETIVFMQHFDIANGDTAVHAAGDRNGAGMLVGPLATVLLDDVDFVGNTTLADGGGAQVQLGGTLHATDCTFDENHADSNGGGLVNFGTLTLTRSTLSENTANADGGGLANASSATLTNCTFSANETNANGGGIYNFTLPATVLSLTHCTLTLNRANDDSIGGGVGAGIARATGTIEVLNSVIANNDSGTLNDDDIVGAFTSLGHNFIGNGDGGSGFTHNVNGDRVGTAAMPLDAKLGF